MSEMKTKRKHATMYLDQWQLDALSWIREKVGVPSSVILRKALDSELSKYDLPKRIRDAK